MFHVQIRVAPVAASEAFLRQSPIFHLAQHLKLGNAELLRKAGLFQVFCTEHLAFFAPQITQA